MSIFAPVKQTIWDQITPNNQTVDHYDLTFAHTKTTNVCTIFLISQEVGTTNEVDLNLYDETSQYLHKTVLYFCKRTVLKVLCYQNI